MTAKTVNYTPEQTAEMVATYVANPTADTVAFLAAGMGKTVKSVVAKLAREGVYKKAEYVGKTGEKPVTKEALVAQLADALGVPAEQLNGVEKATKSALRLILDGLTDASVKAFDGK
jgi:hypothetical protein